jgi:hypothetical protein
LSARIRKAVDGIKQGFIQGKAKRHTMNFYLAPIDTINLKILNKLLILNLLRHCATDEVYSQITGSPSVDLY